MPQWIIDLVGESLAPIVWVAIVAVLVCALAMLVIFLARKLMPGAIGVTARSRAPRLAVMDVARIDEKRRLVLVRRDETEHLILIGGQNDMLVEGGILRLPASVGADTETLLDDRRFAKVDPVVPPVAAPLAAEAARPAAPSSAPAATAVSRPPAAFPAPQGPTPSAATIGRERAVPASDQGVTDRGPRVPEVAPAKREAAPGPQRSATRSDEAASSERAPAVAPPRPDRTSAPKTAGEPNGQAQPASPRPAVDAPELSLPRANLRKATDDEPTIEQGRSRETGTDRADAGDEPRSRPLSVTSFATAIQNRRTSSETPAPATPAPMTALPAAAMTAAPARTPASPTAAPIDSRSGVAVSRTPDEKSQPDAMPSDREPGRGGLSLPPADVEPRSAADAFSAGRFDARARTAATSRSPATTTGIAATPEADMETSLEDFLSAELESDFDDDKIDFAPAPSRDEPSSARKPSARQTSPSEMDPRSRWGGEAATPDDPSRGDASRVPASRPEASRNDVSRSDEPRSDGPKSDRAAGKAPVGQPPRIDADAAEPFRRPPDRTGGRQAEAPRIEATRDVAATRVPGRRDDGSDDADLSGAAVEAWQPSRAPMREPVWQDQTASRSSPAAPMLVDPVARPSQPAPRPAESGPHGARKPTLEEEMERLLGDFGFEDRADQKRG